MEIKDQPVPPLRRAPRLSEEVRRWLWDSCPHKIDKWSDEWEARCGGHDFLRDSPNSLLLHLRCAYLEGVYEDIARVVRASNGDTEPVTPEE